MTVINIEAGVLLRLKAYKIANGMSEAAADAWAAANLNAGVARFNAALAQHKRDLRSEAGIEAGCADLKAWAQLP